MANAHIGDVLAFVRDGGSLNRGGAKNCEAYLVAGSNEDYIARRKKLAVQSHMDCSVGEIETTDKVLMSVEFL